MNYKRRQSEYYIIAKSEHELYNGQSGQCGLGGGLHHQPLLSHFGAGRTERRILQSRCPDRFSGGSSPAVPVQISVFWTLPHQPGHTRKICSAVRANHQTADVNGKRMPGIKIVDSWHSLSAFRCFRPF